MGRQLDDTDRQLIQLIKRLSPEARSHLENELASLRISDPDIFALGESGFIGSSLVEEKPRRKFTKQTKAQEIKADYGRLCIRHFNDSLSKNDYIDILLKQHPSCSRKEISAIIN